MVDARTAQAAPGRPSHVGLIMDGNGRWASSRGLPRLEGHRRGVEALRGAVRTAIEYSLEYLTVYSLLDRKLVAAPSRRSRISCGLLKGFIRKDLVELHKAAVRVKVIGDRENLQPDIRKPARRGGDADAPERPASRWSWRSTTAVARRSPPRRASVAIAKKLAAGKHLREDRRSTPRCSPAISTRHDIPGPRSHHPDVGRAAALQFSALAGGVQRVRLPAGAVARLRSRRLHRRARPVRGTRAAVRGAGRGAVGCGEDWVVTRRERRSA